MWQRAAAAATQKASTSSIMKLSTDKVILLCAATACVAAVGTAAAFQPRVAVVAERSPRSVVENQNKRRQHSSMNTARRPRENLQQPLNLDSAARRRRLVERSSTPTFLLATSSATTADINDHPSNNHDSLSSSSSSEQEEQEQEELWQRMPIPSRGEAGGHAIFGTLHGETLIERYDVWKRRIRNEDGDDGDSDTTPDENPSHADILKATITFGSNLNGHPHFVHGGILSLAVDDLCGFAYESLGDKHAVTANLNVDYRKSVPANTTVQASVQLTKREGRKLYFACQMKSQDDDDDGAASGILYVEATSLYIIPRWAAAVELEEAVQESVDTKATTAATPTPPERINALRRQDET